ncbi:MULTISPECIES: hypothetical protein [Xanthomarina]|jgi:hypothetical protein|uniref:REase AHJR-like domain-containing protein n=1 Tax=Xanthomarina gelatinilytica TaxID=1137281 RepID=M7MCY8_9FLAO|nr:MULTISPECIES: hypothetical protein [Xanthomarina]EMQ94027.1 hypothetical protein D778_01211 [Xanthomarina gelatinilytica]MAL22028.1 hypothetical protein [Xanthomarina sp.]MBF62034.1 hypothetical protein [Xanthomarina sp.]MDX1318044.1 hypothetical protein [Xanthomarina gelatinilytica]HAB27896.1 hypothetical protein [Xanthomarina gelatinilytica]|tara:strand:- start:1551 stop:1922 length:372 start_codon:yes stop_codon:yes gene_type:complete
MIAQDKLENEVFLKESLTYLENLGFDNIKADVDGYETPKSYLKKGSDITITPDIVAEKGGRKHYFEISLKSEKPKLLKSKWRFLDVLTRMKDHRFKIITRRGHYKFTQDMLDELNLDKNPIKL